MPASTLHPNLAKIAAAYDEIIARLNRRTLTPAAARAEIAQLEARDDEGTRWSIDPDTGAWIRKTAFGDIEFDATPPTSGYATADAFDLSSVPRSFNPAQQLTYQAVSDDAGLPGSLLGATRRLSGTAPASSLHARVRSWTARGKIPIAVGSLLVVASAIRWLVGA